MTHGLPAAFLERMQRLLGQEFVSFLHSYDEPRNYGLRVNPLKISPEAFQRISPFRLEPVPWAEEGFYYEEGERPGKHPFYHAGLYYIQEPSAMLPAELLDAQPGEKVLDLCGAPGGKTTQLAGKMKGQGVLVANDNHAERVKAQVKNMELFGVTNGIVLNETPERLAERLPGYFNKILVDAPCSGEGMFRKEEDMVRQWERHSVEQCSVMQRDILHQAARLLAPGGRIVYSTCTFAPEENEGTIAEFLTRNPDFSVVPAPVDFGFAHGNAEWAASARPAAAPEAWEETAGTLRLWPHKIRGEGHFAAILEKRADAVQRAGLDPEDPEDLRKETGRRKPGKEQKQQNPAAGKGSEADLHPFTEFQDRQLTTRLGGKPVVFGETLYMQPQEAPPLEGLKVARAGWHAGSLKRGRFEPSHALAMGLRKKDAVRTLSLSPDSDDLIRYLKGETLSISDDWITGGGDIASKDYVLVCAGDYPVGWAKWSGGMLKNEYPPSWRWI